MWSFPDDLDSNILEPEAVKLERGDQSGCFVSHDIHVHFSGLAMNLPMISLFLHIFTHLQECGLHKHKCSQIDLLGVLTRGMDMIRSSE